MERTSAVQRSMVIRRRRQGVVRGLAVGATALTILGSTAPASAQEAEPTTEVFCSRDNSLGSLAARITGFPREDSFLVFGFVDGSEQGSSVYDGYVVTTDASGEGSIGPVPDGGLPADVGFVVYRDRNGNRRWDPDVDDNVYRGDGTVTDCPSSVTLSPK